MGPSDGIINAMTERKKSLLNGNERVALATKLEKFRPRNMPKEVFLGSPDLEYIDGPFSTFDGHLSRLVHSNASSTDIENYMSQNIPNLGPVAVQYVKDVLDSINETPKHDMIRQWIWDAPTGVLQAFFRLVAMNMIQRMEIGFKDLVIRVIDSWAEVPPSMVPDPEDRETTYGCYARGISHGKEIGLMLINRGNMMARVSPKIKDSLYVAMVMTFAHEFSHFVDDVAPNRGALGAQISTQERKDICELSAHTIGDAVKYYMLGKDTRN